MGARIAAALAVLLVATWSEPAEAHRADVIDQEAAAQAYVAGYPLVVSMRTMQRMSGLLGVNQLFWQSELAGPQSRTVVAPNPDTLFSIAVLDLRAEPMALTVPDVTDRYYTYQFLDAWTESFAYVGTRATGGRAGTWVVTPPGWEGDLPAGAERIEASSPLVVVLGRFLVVDEADIANVTAIREQVTLQPLSAITGDPAAPPPPPLGEPVGTAQDIPTDAAFFDELAIALAINPPATEAQQELFEYVESLGASRAVLDAGADDGFERIAGAVSSAGPVNGFAVNLDIGRYGDDTLTRAVVARVGWGANVPEESVYAVATTDAGGDSLAGTNTYRIRFPAGGLPPVDAYWSLAVYGPDLFFSEHPSGRYTVGGHTPGLVVGDDGSLEIVLSHEQPDGDVANWLPAPDTGFVLMLRLYMPQQSLLDGTYRYPTIERF